MSDFFKELNIIDILGIGVPGCLLVLLLGGDQTAALLWMAQFDNHPLAFGIVLIVAGSLAGMFLQELGDLIEKGLWMCECLDPRLYAAWSVNRKDLNMEELKAHAYPAPEEKTAKAIKFFSVAGAVAVVVCAAGLLPEAMLRSARVTADNARFGGSVWVGLVPLAAGAAAAFFLRPGIKEKLDDLRTIRDANPYIQTRLVGHGNTSKRTLFDGWRFVMRNLILVLAITNLVSLWKPLDLYRTVAGKLIAKNGDMTADLRWLTLFVSCTIVLMLVRYFHYAYLRYKYSLENFMTLDAEKKGSDGGTVNAPAGENKPPEEDETVVVKEPVVENVQ